MTRTGRTFPGFWKVGVWPVGTQQVGTPGPHLPAPMLRLDLVGVATRMTASAFIERRRANRGFPMSDDKPDLDALLEHYGVPTKSRNSYMTNCPLHEDRTPSLSVNIEKGLWNCHSCGEAGDAYTLIQKKEVTDFHGARAFASTLGLATGGTGGGDSELRGSGYTSRRTVSRGKGDRPSNGGYVPAWRRS